MYDTSKLGDGVIEKDELNDCVMVCVIVVERSDDERALDVDTVSDGNFESEGVTDCV